MGPYPDSFLLNVDLAEFDPSVDQLSPDLSLSNTNELPFGFGIVIFVIAVPAVLGLSFQYNLRLTSTSSFPQTFI